MSVIVLPSADLSKDIDFFTSKLVGFRQEKTYPADDPALSVLSGHGLTLQLDRAAHNPPPTIHITSDAEKPRCLTAPNGTVVKFLPKPESDLEIPTLVPKFELSSFGGDSKWIKGRAGMMYRDLVPSRLGGTLIASHIHITQPGLVPDMVHYHAVWFQLIFCYKGWVRVVYEDQGEPFILYPGDCVIQPPEIRHKVIESGDDLQVIEIGVPAKHMTTFDHIMKLPTPELKPEREFNEQMFCHFKTQNAVWERKGRFSVCDTGVRKATKGVAEVQIYRPIMDANDVTFMHCSDVYFMFVLKGSGALNVQGYGDHSLREADAFVIPSNTKITFSKFSDDFELLTVSVSLPRT